MPHPCPHHCPKATGGGPAALIVVVLVIAVAIARPVAHAIGTALEVAAITIGAIAGLAGLAAGTAVAVWLWRQRAMDRQAITQHAPARQAVTGPLRRAIEAPRARLADPVQHDHEHERIWED